MDQHGEESKKVNPEPTEQEMIAEREAKFAILMRKINALITEEKLNIEEAMQIHGRGLIIMCLTNHGGDRYRAADQLRRIGKVLSDLVLDEAAIQVISPTEG